MTFGPDRLPLPDPSSTRATKEERFRYSSQAFKVQLEEALNYVDASP